MATRDDLPELWGIGEILEFVRSQLNEAGAGRLSDESISNWTRMLGFPEPAATLKVGTIWVAEEVQPWLLDRLARPGFRPGRVGNKVDDKTRAAIAALEGSGRRIDDIAAEFGVGRATVQRIWRDHREGRATG